MAGGSVVSSQVMAQVPFKAAEAHLGRPVTLRHKVKNWLRVTEITKLRLRSSPEGCMSTPGVNFVDK